MSKSSNAKKDFMFTCMLFWLGYAYKWEINPYNHLLCFEVGFYPPPPFVWRFSPNSDKSNSYYGIDSLS